MTNDVMLGGLYLLMAAMLVLGGLMSRREPLAKLAVMGLAWVAIFAGGFVLFPFRATLAGGFGLFTFRDDLGWFAQRLRAEATGTPVQMGQTVRIPMAIDGHFWVTASINGHDVKFLVDSGATMTTIGTQTAKTAGVAVSPGRDQLVRTGNGMVR